METAQHILTAFQLHDWYAVVALALMVVLQVVRKNDVPLLTRLWFKIPDGWRWLAPMLTGMATGFTTAFASGLTFHMALVAMVGGALGIGFPSMGMHAAAKESPLHVDGGAGGRPLNLPA